MAATVSYLTAQDDVEVLDINTAGWAVVEAKFQELRALLSAPTTGLNASQAREEQKRAVSQAIARLLDRAQAECRRLLVAGNAKAAVEGGLKTLKLKEEYYGAGSLQLVPAYFHLARTNQFMDKFKRAEEFLSLAQYEVLRHPDADISLNAELHQTFGLLYASDGKLDAALKQLTCSTYYLSCMHGPEHVMTSFGYFDVGNVFAAKSHMEHAMAFYDRVKKIWDTYLSENLAKLLAGEESETPATFGEENTQDAAKMLRGIVGLQAERYGQVHPSPAHGEQVLGMFLLWTGDSAGGFEALLRALEIYKRVMGERHPKCQSLRLLLVNHGFQVPEDTAGVLPEEAPIVAVPPPIAAAAPKAAKSPTPAAPTPVETRAAPPTPPAEEPSVPAVSTAPLGAEPHVDAVLEVAKAAPIPESPTQQLAPATDEEAQKHAPAASSSPPPVEPEHPQDVPAAAAETAPPVDSAVVEKPKTPTAVDSTPPSQEAVEANPATDADAPVVPL